MSSHFAELHAHSSYTFLTGATTPQKLVAEAWNLGLSGLGIIERDGLYSTVQLAEAVRYLDEDCRAGLVAQRPPLGTIFGAELTLSNDNRKDDPSATTLPILVRDSIGYSQLSRLIGDAYLRARDKDHVRYLPAELQRLAHQGHCWFITGGRKSTLRQVLDRSGKQAAACELDTFAATYGVANILVEIVYEGINGEADRNDMLVQLCEQHTPPIRYFATSNPTMAFPSQNKNAAAAAALNRKTTLACNRGYVLPQGGSFLRSAEEMRRLVGPHQKAVQEAHRIGQECAFNLQLLSPGLPPYPLPVGEDEDSYLRILTLQGAARRYGSPAKNPTAYGQIEHELTVIKKLGFAGYFLIVHDIVQFCRRSNILCQGRGSAANSTVCYSLGVTAVDPIANELLFERFLSPERDGPPDIDIDIESRRREEVIQYVYRRYGREKAAQVANTITYRKRSAVRDAARALGYSAGQQDAWSKSVSRMYSLPHPTQNDPRPDNNLPPLVKELMEGFLKNPRHMGIHSGGMVLCDRPITEVVPVEWGRMPGRTVLQWDKDDCAAVGLVKFDLLGLGMLTALHECLDLLAENFHKKLELSDLPLDDPQVYAMLQKADSVGVFQVESRAQMNALPRLKPHKFFDLVVQVALIRPGPIQGESVHPYIRRHNGKEAITYDHPCLESCLKKTLGIPLFQEQLMEIAQAAAGFTGGEADQLRRAIGAKRSAEKMQRIRKRFYQGMRECHGIGAAPKEQPGPRARPGWKPLPIEIGDKIWAKMQAFSAYGFPESHAQSFASLVFYSAWFKCHYPAIFCAALLRSQPMGFYSPQSLVSDARRHGVVVHRPDIQISGVTAQCENNGQEVRLGLNQIQHLGTTAATKIVEARIQDGKFNSIADLVVRTRITTKQVEALAIAGALSGLPGRNSTIPSSCATEGKDRREKLWQVGLEAHTLPEHLPGITLTTAPSLPGMTAWELAIADYVGTRISAYPTQFVRDKLAQRGVICANQLLQQPNAKRVHIAGVVTHRQQPPTAGGVTFLSLEDETGLMNVICSAGLWKRYRTLLTASSGLIIRGIVDSAEGAVTVIADKVEELPLGMMMKSRNFR